LSSIAILVQQRKGCIQVPRDANRKTETFLMRNSEY